uniref:Uncharacterized protein n=1 Tax=Avena sativa TaxID=4498 RepID=A0ACD6ABJ4_AVESA
MAMTTFVQALLLPRIYTYPRSVQRIRLAAKILQDVRTTADLKCAEMEEAALWDVLAKAANIAQLSGLHAAMLVAVATSLIWNLSSRQECAKLEQCARELRALLQWPTGCVIVIQQRTKMAELVNKALRDADGLVEWYNGSTLWCRVRTGRSMVAQFRDTQSRISSYCGLMLVIHGHLLIQPMNPLSSEPNTTM